MSRLTYNLSLAAGLFAIAIGAYLIAGLGVALIVIGTMMVALTIFGAVLTARRD